MLSSGVNMCNTGCATGCAGARRATSSRDRVLTSCSQAFCARASCRGRTPWPLQQDLKRGTMIMSQFQSILGSAVILNHLVARRSRPLFTTLRPFQKMISPFPSRPTVTRPLNGFPTSPLDQPLYLSQVVLLRISSPSKVSTS